MSRDKHREWLALRVTQLRGKKPDGQREYNQRYYTENKERLTEYKKKYYRENKEEILAQHKAYRERKKNENGQRKAD
jgi:hypothetical protein